MDEVKRVVAGVQVGRRTLRAKARTWDDDEDDTVIMDPEEVDRIAKDHAAQHRARYLPTEMREATTRTHRRG